MNAWLVTWEMSGDLVDIKDKIAAILSSRRSERSIVPFLEMLYLRATSSASEMAYYANRSHLLQHRVEVIHIINGVPHGDRISYGNNPRLYARKVTDLTVQLDKESGEEIISWTEPAELKWKDNRRGPVEVASEGEQTIFRRSASAPICKDLI